MTKKAKPRPGAGGGREPKKEPEATFRPFGALKTMRDALKAKEQISSATPGAGSAKASAPGSRLPDGRSAAAPTPTIPTGRGNAENEPAREEDEALSLYRMMNGVTPLASTSKTRLPKSQSAVLPSNLDARKAAAEAPVRAQEDLVHAHLRALVEGGRFEVQDDGRRVEGRRHGVPPDVARKLRRGNYPIDARLDLHGETASSAPKVLTEFLKAQRSRGERCVLVVHGKGEHSPRGVGILRGEMAAWLSQGGGSPHVAAFATAGDADGGEGAVYVLLTR